MRPLRHAPLSSVPRRMLHSRIPHHTPHHTTPHRTPPRADPSPWTLEVGPAAYHITHHTTPHRTPHRSTQHTQPRSGCKLHRCLARGRRTLVGGSPAASAHAESSQQQQQQQQPTRHTAHDDAGNRSRIESVGGCWQHNLRRRGDIGVITREGGGGTTCEEGWCRGDYQGRWWRHDLRGRGDIGVITREGGGGTTCEEGGCLQSGKAGGRAKHTATVGTVSTVTPSAVVAPAVVASVSVTMA